MAGNYHKNRNPAELDNLCRIVLVYRYNKGFDNPIYQGVEPATGMMGIGRLSGRVKARPRLLWQASVTAV